MRSGVHAQESLPKPLVTNQFLDARVSARGLDTAHDTHSTLCCGSHVQQQS